MDSRVAAGTATLSQGEILLRVLVAAGLGVVFVILGMLFSSQPASAADDDKSDRSISQLLETVTEPVTPVLETVTTPLAPVVESVAEPAAPLIEPVAPIVASVAHSVEPVTPVVEAVLEPVEPVLAPVSGPLHSTLERALSPVMAELPSLQPITTPVFEATQPLVTVADIDGAAAASAPPATPTMDATAGQFAAFTVDQPAASPSVPQLTGTGHTSVEQSALAPSHAPFNAPSPVDDDSVASAPSAGGGAVGDLMSTGLPAPIETHGSTRSGDDHPPASLEVTRDSTPD